MDFSDSSSSASTGSNQKKEEHALPEIGLSEIMGLLELLKSIGGREDIYKLAAELKMEFGETLGVIRAAELLKLVHTPGGDVVLEPLGEEITKAKINEKKELLRVQMSRIPIVQKVCEFLKKNDPCEAARDEVEEALAEWIPNENAEVAFDNLVAWGRYAELFGYNDDSQTLYLDLGDSNEESE